MRIRGDDRTLDLLNWEPPKVVHRFEVDHVRAATLRAQISKAVAVALKDCGKNRDEVAQEMTDYLGETTGKNMLDAYASEAREDHVINVVRFMGLVHATGDIRLLQLLAEPFGLAVVEKKYLPAIDEAMDVDRREALAAELDRLDQRIAVRRKHRRGTP
ncbi:hypothetical protein [Rhodospirillum centenum]|uniref:Phage-related DNA transposition protein(B) n=1 Tax=Rhodospirillum centenum (strain ATCC 51521 / SW) TaxID=414684 RepID=B6ISS1_RHOCS|nr:hypothetical protein [Rhodospirillum centenum]ACI98507.1 phage-related DNA transposition protein(B) [Rhodospirillum centenum SW]